MAISQPWFQNWQPPTDLITDNHQIDTPERNRVKSFCEEHRYVPPTSPALQMVNILPYLISFSMITNKEKQHLKSTPSYPFPSEEAAYPQEETGPFKTRYRWKYMDFAFPTQADRDSAIFDRGYNPKNNLPLGLEVHRDRIFITIPKWKPGIPSTLAVLPRVPKEPSPLLEPYPNWEWHSGDTCDGLVSVFRIQADTCNRLWVLDSGQIDISIKPRQVCPPKIVIFDLITNKVVVKYRIPSKFIKQDSLHSNIVVDIREGDCEDVHAYVADVWRFGLLVFSLKQMKSWRITDHLFYPDPLAAAYKLHGLEFEWTDGIFSLALSPEQQGIRDRLLYFHPMSSFREFYVKTSIICNETGWSESKDGFKVLGESRGRLGHASAAGMDKNGVLFYNLVSRDSIGCWDSRKSYTRRNLGIIAKSSVTLLFPNDLKIIQENRPSIWITSNRLPLFLYKGLDMNDYNFRIMSAYIDEAVKGTVCDPEISYFDSFDPVENGEDCY